MSSLVTYPDTASHRAQVVAESVVSAYINEIASPARPRRRARNRPTGARSQTAVAHQPLAARNRRRAPAPRRQAALELGA